ncbi:HTH-type transcriptional repressor FabR [Bermanella marisrubri]|uniref:Transcriptional regulator n=1 Tax=Bermanella marisrubri TaxID=207949 RepID=Q1N1Y3_9GAMM|nr:HTH-type transcriptional repressor FabR [Bermanella marisrubri]EAT12148.1 transcriptional regulator [Oceanobacter sp. RED65] [Bermanella marisrubri]QIZ83625.1 HTH-type transcriptional repressor FabR [Bermanella marisrubri]
MSTRAEQKLKTRQSIIDAALDLSKDKGFPALSLREVTRQAGIAPATFYRHFVDMEDLGLALVDQVSLILRQLMRQARQRVKIKGSVVNTSVETFMEFVENYPNLIRLLNTDIASGPKPFRESIIRETRRFAEELTDDLNSKEQRDRQPLAHVPELAEMMVLLVFNQGVAALEMDTEQRKQLIKKLNLELRMLLAGSHALYLKIHGKK